LFAIAKARSGGPGKKASSASIFSMFMCGCVPLKYFSIIFNFAPLLHHINKKVKRKGI
jgi:hypothetical protein